jgi:hypothetical protein
MNAALQPLVADRRTQRALWALTAAALLSVAAGYVHLAYVQSHWREWWAYGVFFLATGSGQLLYAPLILRWPRAWLLLVGIVGNVAIVGMYLISRTAGPPLGPHAHIAERAGAVDVAVTTAEIALVCVLLTMLGANTRHWIINGLVVAALLLVAMRLTGRLP